MYSLEILKTFFLPVPDVGDTPAPHRDQPLGRSPTYAHLLHQALHQWTPPSVPDQGPQQACRLPRLDPWDPAILRYVEEWPRPEAVGSGLRDLLYTSRDRLVMNMSVLVEAALARSEVHCNFTYVGDSKQVTLESESVALSSRYNSILAVCVTFKANQQEEIHRKLHFYIPQPKPKATTKPLIGKQYSITLFIIDALSQMNGQRSLPRALAEAARMGGILFQGHHKVGYNSVPNVMAISSGSVSDGRGDWPSFQPVIQSLFQSHGWTTVMYEEELAFWPMGGLVYNSTPFDIDYFGGHRYLRGSPNHTNPIHIIRDYHHVYRDSPLFMHIHLLEYSHDDINRAKNYDVDLAAMLRNLSDSTVLEDTFLLLAADHGYNAGDFPKTVQGTIESNMPLLVIVPPASLAQDHSDWLANLRRNSKGITSQFDIHQMLRHLLGLAIGEEEVEAGYQGLEGPGGSLLRPLGARSCSEAGVDLRYCSCSSGQVTLEPAEVEGLVRAVLTDINTFLEPLWGCQTLQLDRVTDVSMKTEEGEVVVQATVEVTPKPVAFLLSITKPNVTNTPSVSLVRLDRYSLTSHCVPQSEVLARPLCVCHPE